jgi:hypothetical protein
VRLVLKVVMENDGDFVEVILLYSFLLEAGVDPRTIVLSEG